MREPTATNTAAGIADFPSGSVHGVTVALNYIAAAVVDGRNSTSFEAVWIDLVDMLGADVRTEQFATALRLLIQSGNEDPERPRPAYDYFVRAASLAGFTGCGRTTGVWSGRALRLIPGIRHEPGSLLLIVRYIGQARAAYWRPDISSGSAEWYRVVRVAQTCRAFSKFSRTVGSGHTTYKTWPALERMCSRAGQQA